jgi:peptidoglycan/xylan/chitin deacetylase (PgdA/CDA1 family)
VLRAPLVNRALRAVAAARGHSLVLVYHRLGAALPADCEIVPSVTVDVFWAQLQALGEVADLVSLEAIVEGRRPNTAASHGRKPAVAVTFDDDLTSHVEYTLPVLRQWGVPATFFLSGRALSGLGAYWFQHLETLLNIYGHERTSMLLGVPAPHTGALVLACERDADLRRRVSDLGSGLARSPILQPDAFRTLHASGMTVGFHTLEHDTLPSLDDAALEAAVDRGRAELAAAVGAPIRYFAYPHGKADARSAAAVRRAGFIAAFTGRRQPVRRTDDRYHLGRWEPGPLGVDDLLAHLGVRLHAAGNVPTAQSRPWM